MSRNWFLISDLDQFLTRAELETRAARGAVVLSADGLGHGDRVAIIMRNDLTCCKIMRARALAGAIAVQPNWHTTASEVADILADCEANLVILYRDLRTALRPTLSDRATTSVGPTAKLTAAYELEQGSRWDKFPEWAESRDQQQPVSSRPAMRPMMRYASGSTGIPKGITRIAEPNTAGSADYYDTLRYIASQMFGFRASAHFMTAAPLYHSAPNTLTSMAMENMSVTLLARFYPVQFLETIDRQRITHVYLVPTMMVRLLKLSDAIKARYNLSCVEFCVSTGSTAPHPVKRAMIDW